MERPLRNRAQRNNRAAQITVNKFKDEPKGKKEKADRKKIGKSKGKITPNKFDFFVSLLYIKSLNFIL